MAISGKTITLVSLALTGLGTIFAGAQVLPQYWDKEEPASVVATAPPPPASVPTCANISGGTGNTVDCSTTINQRAALDRIQSLELTLGASNISQAGRFNEFDGKLVRLKLMMEAVGTDSVDIKFDETSESEFGFKRYILSIPNECVDEYVRSCGGIQYIFLDKEDAVYYTNGSFVVDGYFVGGFVVGMHQGWVSFSFDGVSRQDAALADGATR